MKFERKNVDKYIKKVGIMILLIIGCTFLGNVNAKAEYKKVEIDESVPISSMGEYKQMDYSFLEEFPYGGTYEKEPFMELETAKEMAETSDIRMKAGRTVQTEGFYKAGDGGSATYILEETDSEGSIALANGLYARLLPDTKEIHGKLWAIINVKQLGARGDGEKAEQEYINNAIKCGEKALETGEGLFRAIVYVPKGEYKCTNEIQLNAKNINFVGAGNETILFTDNDYKREENYYEFFFMLWGAENLYVADFKVEARETDLNKYMRQVSFIDCNNVYMYGVYMNIPQEAFSKDYYVDKQYTNLTFYSGNKNMTVDNCRMDLMCSTYRGANLGILDFYCRGEENITIMNSEFHDNARDEQIGMFTGVTDREKSHIKNVDFINNTIYSYSPIDKEAAGGHRTMCFTLAYAESRNMEDIRVAGNHFISDVDSKFMTFGTVKDCKVEYNMIEVRSTQGGSYIFDSSNNAVENVLIQNNEIYLTGRWEEGTGKGSMLGGKATLKGNKVVSESYLGSMVDVGGVVLDNTYINFSTLSSGSGNSDNFSGNTIISYGKLDKIVNLKSGYTNEGTCYYNDNYVVDYRRENYKKGPWDCIVAVTCGAIQELQFQKNTYLAPNRLLTGEEKLSIFYNKAQIGNLFATENTLQGVDGYIAYGGTVTNNSKIENNNILPFTYEEEVPVCSEITLTHKGSAETEIFTTEENVSLKPIVKAGFFNEKTGVYDKEEIRENKDLDWYVSLDGLAKVTEGLVERKEYGTVTVYAVPRDGSFPYQKNEEGLYEPQGKAVKGKCTIHFVQDFAKDILLEQETVILQPNKKHQINYQVLPYKVVSQKLRFTSSDESVAKVRSDGLIEGVSKGKAVITCTTLDGSNITKEIQVTVEPLTVKKINLNKSQWYDFEEEKKGGDRGVKVGETYQLEVISYVPENAVNCHVGKWVSTNEAVATVDEKGLVTAVGPGVCEIRAYTSDEKYYSAFGVWVNPAKVEKVQADYTHNSVKFTWDSQENVYGYYIYQYETEKGQWKKVGEIKDCAENSYSLWNLNSGREYRFYVTSYIKRWDAKGKEHIYTEPSEEIVFTTYEDDVLTNIKTQYETMGVGVGESRTLGVYTDKSKISITSEDESIMVVENVPENADVRITGVKEGVTYLSLKAKDKKGLTKRIPVLVWDFQKIKDDVCTEGGVKSLKVKWKVSEPEKQDGFVINKKWETLEARQMFVPMDKLRMETDENGITYASCVISGLDNNKEYSLSVAPYKILSNVTYVGEVGAVVTGTTLAYVNVDNIQVENTTFINAGESQKITATIGTENVTEPYLFWKVYNPAIVQVLETGMEGNIGYALVKGLKAGISKVNVIAEDDNNYQCQIKVIVLPETVKDLKATAEREKVILSWKEDKDAEGYIVYRYDGLENQWFKVAQTEKSLYEDLNLEEGREYRYKVVAYISGEDCVYEGGSGDEVRVITVKKDGSEESGGSGEGDGSQGSGGSGEGDGSQGSGGSGESGGNNEESDKQVKFTNKVISGFKLGKNNTTNIKLSWKIEKDADGYEIYQYKNKKWCKVKTVNTGKQNNIIIKKLSPGNTYQFRIRAYKKQNQNTIYTKFKSLKVMTKPSKVKISKITVKNENLTVQWKKIKCQGYEIQYSTSKAFKKNVKKLTVSKSKTKVTAKKLKSNKVYYVRVRAYSKTEGKKYYGVWSKGKKVESGT